VVPRESTDAFLAARFAYNQTLPLSASEMRLFVDGVYAGLSHMPAALPNSELTLPMGQDRRVEVKSLVQAGQDGVGGILSKRKTENTDYLFQITNRRAKTNLVEVYDRYPVAKNKVIKVDVPSSATEPTEKNIEGQPGVVVWRKELAGDEEWEIRHQYSVSYPANSQVVRQ